MPKLRQSCRQDGHQEDLPAFPAAQVQGLQQGNNFSSTNWSMHYSLGACFNLPRDIHLGPYVWNSHDPWGDLYCRILGDPRRHGTPEDALLPNGGEKVSRYSTGDQQRSHLKENTMQKSRQGSPLAVRLLIIVLVLCAQVALSSPVDYITIEVRAGGVYIQGKPVTKNTTLSDYEAILGKPDRTTRLKNTIYTYDKLGLLLYQKPGQNSILSISLDLIKSNHKFSPNRSFQGIFIVADRVLRTSFPQASLLTFNDVEIDQDDRPLTYPVTGITYGKNSIILEYLTSRQTLEGVGISWKE